MFLTQNQTLILVALLLAAVLLWAVWLARRCTAGWRAWLLSVIARVYGAVLFNWRANRDCPFPQDDPALIIANHTSPVDPILIWIKHDRRWRRHHKKVIGYLMAREYYEKRGVIGWICRAMESIPVDRQGRDMQGVRAALRRLRDKRLLGLFPEGGINDHPERGFRKYNTGAAFLALKAGVPVYPVFVHNAPRGSGMVTSFLKPCRVRVTYGDPIDLSQHFDPKALSSDALEAATDFLMDQLAELGTVAWDPHITPWPHGGRPATDPNASAEETDDT